MKTIYHPVTGNDDIRFQHLDYKGTLRSQSNEFGLPVGGQNIYYPYGEIMQLGSSPTHRRYFQTGESDHTGFVHMGARYYDPSIGRFLTPDPIDASVSAYTFASGNPIMFFDPSGLVIEHWAPTIQVLPSFPQFPHQFAPDSPYHHIYMSHNQPIPQAKQNPINKITTKSNFPKALYDKTNPFLPSSPIMAQKPSPKNTTKPTTLSRDENTPFATDYLGGCLKLKQTTMKQIT